ncbi:hypothetical protein SAMN05878276_0308 [Aquipseudomonas alcaligenes]|jgi:hypothetical protein|uniref:hypothetical protein n=1 Tax=Aquipseudomonas alcaligenes TaxID=43263 RepID=UPI0009572549|nr:hypothetical protein [Pseudomonas alcaligenes]SIR81235.1 hypothetical protein SAMN05878276_0308 [Pseudomonas alcaligenes]
MDISVTEATPGGWIVRLDDCDVPFRTQADAGRFVERLQQRLEAPHDLPVSAGHLPVTQEVEHHG